MNTYTCAMCGGVFEKGWSDAEANAEAVDIWSVKNASVDDSMAVVCDDCWQRIKPPTNVAAQLAKAMVQCWRFLQHRDRAGRRRLFDAVNEATAYAAHGFPRRPEDIPNPFPIMPTQPIIRS